MKNSPILVQWDPDHLPDGAKSTRRAIQIGLRGEALLELNEEALIEVIDLTEFVTEQRPRASGGDYCKLITPKESVYSPQSAIVS